MNEPMLQPMTLPAGRRRWRRFRRQGGFTLIEAALATVIVSTGVLSILAAQQAYHQKNNWANHTGTAMLLANEIRERTFGMPFHDPTTGGGSTVGPESGENTSVTETSALGFDDLDDFAGQGGDGVVFISQDATFTPTGLQRINGPIDARGLLVPDMDQWSQHVTVEEVDPLDPAVVTGFTDNKTKMYRMTVRVYRNYNSDANPLATLTWLATGSR